MAISMTSSSRLTLKASPGGYKLEAQRVAAKTDEKDT